MCNLQVLLLMVSFWRLGSWPKSYGFIPSCAIIPVQGLQINSFFLNLVGNGIKMASGSLHKIFLVWVWCVCARRDEGFLHIPETEIQAALPSTSKLD